ncbi:MAG: hypothetical protein KGD58_18595 [Candidatus Lokiarchaeota archaeon]|nr:hypothetical protein [Candidatus Lokiarchaeota archaeon]
MCKSRGVAEIKTEVRTKHGKKINLTTQESGFRKSPERRGSQVQVYSDFQIHQGMVCKRESSLEN